jgi:hypothetical protein
VHPASHKATQDYYLPAGESFPVHLLARVLHVTRNHVINLIDAGELKCAVDLRSPGASRSLIRVPRTAVVEFLESRKILVVESPGKLKI